MSGPSKKRRKHLQRIAREQPLDTGEPWPIDAEVALADAQRQIAILTEQRDNHFNRANQRQGEIERLRYVIEEAQKCRYLRECPGCQDRFTKVLDYTQPELGP
jgi:hypothetical protein